MSLHYGQPRYKCLLANEFSNPVYTGNVASLLSLRGYDPSVQKKLCWQKTKLEKANKLSIC